MAQNPEAIREKMGKFNHWKIKTSTLKKKKEKSRESQNANDQLGKIIFNLGKDRRIDNLPKIQKANRNQ